MNDETLGRLERLEREATPGRWTWKDKIGWSGIETPDGENLLMYGICDAKVLGWHSRIVFDNESDKALLLEARNALPLLLSEIKRLREENGRLTTQLWEREERRLEEALDEMEKKTMRR